MPKGVVKWFDERKGYGFIVPNEKNGEKDLFVHQSQILGSIEEGDQVEYEKVQGEKGPQAINVKPILE